MCQYKKFLECFYTSCVKIWGCQYIKLSCNVVLFVIGNKKRPIIAMSYLLNKVVRIWTRKIEYGVNIHDKKYHIYKKIPSNGTALWLLFYIPKSCTVRPSIRSKNSHLTVSTRRPLAPLWVEFFARCRRHYICALKHTNVG